MATITDLPLYPRLLKAESAVIHMEEDDIGGKKSQINEIGIECVCVWEKHDVSHISLILLYGSRERRKKRDD